MHRRRGGGEHRRGKPVAKLVPVSEEHPKRTPGQLRGRVRMSGDFDDPLPDDLRDLFEGKVKEGGGRGRDAA